MENNKEGCPVKGCLGKLLCTAIPTFVVLFVMGYLIHHVWLMPIYEQTASLWRPADQMKDMMPLLLVYYAALSLVISGFFCKFKKAKMQECANASEADCKIGGKYCPIKCGACFGLMIGLFMGVLCAGSYIWTPIPGELAVKWFIGDIVQGIVIGIVLTLICYCKNKKCDASK
jgi:hypothetical protein